MAGAQYIALSGMRSRLDELDRLSADIANAGTAGYKSERTTDAQANRPRFDAVLQTAIDVAPGGRRLDASAGPLSTTGRDLDFALEGDGFFTVQTPGGPRYTRNGHFTAAQDGALTTTEGHPVSGVAGPITLGPGPITVDQDGTVHAGATVAGRLAIVQFDDTGRLTRESGALLRSDVPPSPATAASVKGGVLEESNVSVIQRVAELTNVSRTFEALQKALSVVMNDIDGRAVDLLGRRG
jgi:flagellar basal body rod protein FlgG